MRGRLTTTHCIFETLSGVKGTGHCDKGEVAQGKIDCFETREQKANKEYYVICMIARIVVVTCTIYGLIIIPL